MVAKEPTRLASEQERLDNVLRWRIEKGLSKKPFKKTVKTFNALKRNMVESKTNNDQLSNHR